MWVKLTKNSELVSPANNKDLNIKQHDFLMHRVVALLETIHKHNMNKYVDGLPQADINAEETLSRQDVSIKSLKRENSFIKK